MDFALNKTTLELDEWRVNAIAFVPESSSLVQNALAVFTHGITAHKEDVLTWSTRLAEMGMASIIFDLPGHYLGSFNEVHDLEQFKNKVHQFFHIAYEQLIAQLGNFAPPKKDQTGLSQHPENFETLSP